MTVRIPVDTGQGQQSRFVVGEPTHEKRLYELLIRRGMSVCPPGQGRSLYLVREAEIGNGRPDALLLVTSSTALNAFMRSGLRLPSLNAARSFGGLNASASEEWSRKLARDLQREGWSHRALMRAADIPKDVLAVEAKVKDWRAGIRQAARYKTVCGKSALLLPKLATDKVSGESLKIYGIGLISASENQLSWEVPPIERHVEVAYRAWMVEQLIRGIEDGRAYKLSRSRKVLSATSKDWLHA